MKTAVSIPDPIFEQAEKLAAKEGLSRSELYATALKELLERKEKEALAEHYAEVFGEVDSRLDPVIARIQGQSLPRDKEGW